LRVPLAWRRHEVRESSNIVGITPVARRVSCSRSISFFRIEHRYT
jgi:hypothetical protein